MFILEGNIGAGKSTFLKLVVEHLASLSVSLEPINDWQKKISGQSLLTNFYEHPKRWAYTLETLTMMYRIHEHVALQKQNNPRIIIERSIYSGHYCFAHNSYTQGFLSHMEWNLYMEWFTWLQQQCMPPHGFIYLRVDPKIAYERIKKRNRHAEKTVSLHYLKQIHERHEAFLIEKNNILTRLHDIPVLVLDCNQEFEHNTQQLQQLLTRVKQFIEKTAKPEFQESPSFMQHIP